MSPLSPWNCEISPSVIPMLPILYHYEATLREFLPYSLRDSHEDRCRTRQVFWVPLGGS